MRNKTDFTLAPEALFLNPWQGQGFQLLLEPDFIWRPISKSKITGFGVSADAEVNAKLSRMIRSIRRGNNFSDAIEYNSVPVVLNKATFRKSYVLTHDRLLLSGAVGVRLTNRYLREYQDSEIDADARLEGYFSDCRDGNKNKEIPVYSGLLEPNIDFAIPCRNTFNYFHFMTEALCQLTLLDGLDFQGNIYFHFPNPEDRQRAFTKTFVQALFPELSERVFFERAPKDYDKVLTAYDLSGSHWQAPDIDTVGIEEHVPGFLRDNGGITDASARRSLAANTVNTTLFALRERALKAIEGHSFDHLPKRFFVGRGDQGSRVRPMEGEDKLFEHLGLFGFEYVVFETLSPLEQIAIMAQAEIMVSSHGAGFTNMLFANPDAYVIELGTIQTAQYRWGDFWPLAHVSGCTYVNFFADTRDEDPQELAARDTGGLMSVSLSDFAISRIMAFIVPLLGHYPKLGSIETVESLSRQLVEAGVCDKAMHLLEGHQDMLERSAALCLLKADCHKDMGEPKSELLALDAAYKLDPARWQTLIRMIWCASGCDRPQVIRWALVRLQADFPDRHTSFVGQHKWLRYVA